MQQLKQTIDNLNEFLKDSPKNMMEHKPNQDEIDQVNYKPINIELQYKQNTLLENGIITQIMLLLKLINFQIYGSSDEELGLKELSQDQKSSSSSLFTKSAQRIAYTKLNKVVEDIYNALFRCIMGNSECSKYILSNDLNFVTFMIQQYHLYKRSITRVLMEAIKCMNGEEIMSDILRKWVNMLRPVNPQNIEDQTFYINLVKLSVVDGQGTPLRRF